MITLYLLSENRMAQKKKKKNQKKKTFITTLVRATNCNTLTVSYLPEHEIVVWGRDEVAFQK